MNEVSIIINGVRYDAIPLPSQANGYECKYCDLYRKDGKWDCSELNSCPLHKGFIFKKSDKKFEK